MVLGLDIRCLEVAVGSLQDIAVHTIAHILGVGAVHPPVWKQGLVPDIC